MDNSPGNRLERYTLARPHEVLLVTIEVDGETDLVAVYKGFSSSLVRQTDFDPDVPLIPDGAKIEKIDRVKAPYRSESPDYLQKGLTWAVMEQIIAGMSI